MQSGRGHSAYCVIQRASLTKSYLNIDFSYYCNSRKELAKISHRATPNFQDGEEIQSNHVPQNRE